MNYEKWREVSLKDITTDGKGSYGIGAAATDYSETLYRYLRITDISDDGELLSNGKKSVDDKKAGQYLLEPNDIVFARTGNSTGRSYFYEGTEEKMVYAGFLIKFSLDPSKVNPKYMKYYTKSKNYKNWVNSYKSGSTRSNINAKTYEDMLIELPPRSIQNSLVKILSVLDEKIEINNQINETLENMAQELFKRWFVNFEFPNENGEPYKSSGGEMIESELGLIPKRWRVGGFEDLGKIISGGTPSKSNEEYFTKSGIAWITPKDLSNNRNKFVKNGATDITEMGLKNSSAKLMPKGSVLYSSRAPIGYIAIADNEVSTNQGFKSIVPHENISSEFVFQMLKNNTDKIIGQASGSTFKEISGKGMKSIKIIIPEYDVLDAYSKLVSPFLKMIRNNENSTLRLKNLRDTLLPKLMSGEIRVPLEDLEESLAEVKGG